MLIAMPTGIIIFNWLATLYGDSLGGEGGRHGPTLDGVATRLTHDQLIRQALQGELICPPTAKTSLHPK